MYRSLLIAMMALLAALLMGPAVLAQTDEESMVEPQPRVEGRAEIDTEEPRAEIDIETRGEDELALEESEETWETYGYDDSPMKLEKEKKLEHGEGTFGFDDREPALHGERELEPQSEDDVFGYQGEPRGRRPMAGRQEMMERMRERHQERMDKMDEIIGMLEEAETALDEENVERAKELLENARTELEALKQDSPCRECPMMQEPPAGRPETVPPVTTPDRPVEEEPEEEVEATEVPETGTAIPGWPGVQRHYTQLV